MSKPPIKRSRQRVYRPTAADKDLAAKQRIEVAMTSLDDPPRSPPALIRDATTKKWARWEEVDAEDRTPAALLPSVESFARTLNAAVDGKARKLGKSSASSKTQLGASRHIEAVRRFGAIGHAHLLARPFTKKRIDAIEKAAELHNIRLPCKAKSFARWLERHPEY